MENRLTADPAQAAVLRDFVVARLRYNAAWYDAEARLNQAVGYLYEAQAHRSDHKADQHHRRSLRFLARLQKM